MFSRLKYLYLAHLSKPVGDRALYRAIGRRKPRKILELGLGFPDRTLRMIELASRQSAGEAIRYVAIDLFEARTADKQVLALKEAHRVLKPSGAQVQLIPGTPAAALPRTANALANMDLVLISAEHDDAALEAAWFYFPRMLHAGSLVLRESAAAGGQRQFVEIPAAEIATRANSGRRRAA